MNYVMPEKSSGPKTGETRYTVVLTSALPVTLDMAIATTKISLEYHLHILSESSSATVRNDIFIMSRVLPCRPWQLLLN